MACNCKHNQQAIDDGMKAIIDFGYLFVKRMTKDSPHNDRRRKDFNRAIFGYWEDGSTYQVWDEIDLDMVMKCFNDAIEDWRRTWCDVPTCKRK